MCGHSAKVIQRAYVDTAQKLTGGRMLTGDLLSELEGAPARQNRRQVALVTPTPRTLKPVLQSPDPTPEI